MNQKAKIISFSAIMIAVLAVLFWIGRPDNSAISGNGNLFESAQYASGGVLEIEKKDFDFGSISMKRGNVSYAATIKNTSAEPITIKKIYTSCMCTTATLIRGERSIGPFGMPGHGVSPKMNEIIAPGGEAEIEVVFDPAAHGPAGVGRIQRTITLENNVGQPVELQFAAIVTP